MSISGIDFLGVIHRRVPFSTRRYSWRIQRHRMSELIVRSDAATLPVP